MDKLEIPIISTSDKFNKWHIRQLQGRDVSTVHFNAVLGKISPIVDWCATDILPIMFVPFNDIHVQEFSQFFLRAIFSIVIRLSKMLLVLVIIAKIGLLKLNMYLQTVSFKSLAYCRCIFKPDLAFLKKVILRYQLCNYYSTILISVGKYYRKRKLYRISNSIH